MPNARHLTSISFLKLDSMVENRTVIVFAVRLRSRLFFSSTTPDTRFFFGKGKDFHCNIRAVAVWTDRVRPVLGRRPKRARWLAFVFRAPTLFSRAVGIV